MGDRSAIEWTDATWNPTTGCDRVSPGCDNCYALALAARLKAMGNPRYQQDGDPPQSGPGFGLTLHEDVLALPLSWTRPRRVFVNSMSDLFHDDVPGEFVARVFEVMERTPRHVYQLLTKRPGRMSSWARRHHPDPLHNVWLGTSVEDQKWAAVRIPKLRDTPAAIRFVSCEPLLAPVDLSPWIDALDWVIVGGESGVGARSMDPAWALELRDQCRDAGVAFFFKQWGGRTSKTGGRLLDGQTWDEMPTSSSQGNPAEVRPG